MLKAPALSLILIYLFFYLTEIALPLNRRFIHAIMTPAVANIIRL